jgi:nucleotide-binding universal stress UspA family protein
MPQKLQRLLVPLDGSALAERSLAQALAVARPFGAEVVLLRVLESGGATENRRYVDSVRWRAGRDKAREYLEDLAKRMESSGVRIVTDVAEGRPAEEIVKAVRERRADMVVLCTHGRGKASRFHLGSTASKVVGSCGVSLLLLRGGREGVPEEAVGLEEGLRYRRILVPLDGSRRAEWALHLAAAIAREHGCELLMLCVVPKPGWEVTAPQAGNDRDLVQRVAERERRYAEEHLRRQQARLEAPGIAVRGRIVEARHVVEGIRDVAREEGVDLVVMSAHGASGPAPWPHGSVTSRFIEHGDVPVLVFQDLPVRSLETEETVEAGEELPETTRVGAR